MHLKEMYENFEKIFMSLKVRRSYPLLEGFHVTEVIQEKLGTQNISLSAYSYIM